jgi:hypothetical protein
MTGYLICGFIVAAFAAPLLAATRPPAPPLRRKPLGPERRAFIGVMILALAAVLFPVVTA